MGIYNFLRSFEIEQIPKDKYFENRKGIEDYLVDDKLDFSILFFHGLFDCNFL